MNDLLTQLKSNWLILAFIASIFIWYADTNSRLSSVEAKQESQQQMIDEISQLQIDIAVIKANVEFIKQKVR